MNAAHWHLIINHIPVIGMPFALALLAVARWRGSRDNLLMALCAMSIVGVLAVPVYLSGEGAEEIVEHREGVSELAIEEHEEGAKFAAIAGAATGLLAGATWFAIRRRGETKLTSRLVIGCLVVAAWATSTLARVAYLGGHIRHPEISDPG